MKVCPRCGRRSERLLALSRTDNKTKICDVCGVEEALNEFLGISLEKCSKKDYENESANNG